MPCSRNKFPGAQPVHVGAVTIWTTLPRDKVAEERLVAQLMQESGPKRQRAEQRRREDRSRQPHHDPNRRLPQRSLQEKKRALMLRNANSTPTTDTPIPSPGSSVASCYVPLNAPRGPRAYGDPVKIPYPNGQTTLPAISEPIDRPSKHTDPSTGSIISDSSPERSLLDRLEERLSVPESNVPVSPTAQNEYRSNHLTAIAQPSTSSNYPSQLSLEQIKSMLNQIHANGLSSHSTEQAPNLPRPNDIKADQAQPANPPPPSYLLSCAIDESNLSNFSNTEETTDMLRHRVSFWQEACKEQNKQLEHMRHLLASKDKELAVVSELLASAEEKVKTLESRHAAAMRALGSLP